MKILKSITSIFIMNSLPNTLNSKGLILLLSGLLFFSCKKDNSTLQLPGDPELPANTLYSDTFSVKLSSVLVYNDFVTTNPNKSGVQYLMVGGFQSSDFGTTLIKSYVQMKLAKQYVDLSDATIDSVFVELDYNYYFGDSTQSQTLDVYQLDQAIENDEKYYINSTEPAYSNLLGSKTFNAKPNSGENIRIPISNTAFVNSIVNGPKNNVDFLAQFYGLAFVPGGNTGIAARINLSSSLSGLFVYYKQNGENKTYTLTLKNDRYHTVAQDRSLTSLTSLVNEYDEIASESVSNKSFFQAGTGVRTKISFPYLDKLISEKGDIYIHKAELFIPAQGSNLPDSLYLIKLNTDGSVAYTSGFVSTVQNDISAVNGIVNTQYSKFYNLDLAYKFQIRSYLQGLVYGELPNNGLILTTSKNNLQFNGGYLNNQNAASDQIKLRLYYTQKTN